MTSSETPLYLKRVHSSRGNGHTLKAGGFPTAQPGCGVSIPGAVQNSWKCCWAAAVGDTAGAGGLMRWPQRALPASAIPRFSDTKGFHSTLAAAVWVLCHKCLKLNFSKVTGEVIVWLAWLPWGQIRFSSYMLYLSLHYYLAPVDLFQWGKNPVILMTILP